jgi:hypothetical protein
MTTLDPGASGHQVLSDAEIANLRGWMKLSPAQKIDFFEEMIELAHRSGALSADRLALRDADPDTA